MVVNEVKAFLQWLPQLEESAVLVLWSTVEFEFQECDEYAARDGLIMDITTNFQKMLWTIEMLRA